MVQKKYPLKDVVETIYETMENKISDGGLDSENLTLKEIKKVLEDSVDLFENRLCMDCGMNTLPTEYYMVNDEVWYTAVPEGKGMLCIGCLESRLGRSLNQNDFTDALINSVNEKESKRLKIRKMI